MLASSIKSPRTLALMACLVGALGGETVYGCAGQYVEEELGTKEQALDDYTYSGGGGTTTTTITTINYNKIVYLHGRSMGGWPADGKLGASSGWDHVTLSYNGSARMSDAGVRSTVKNALSTNCRAPNQCVLVCYSAGCARMLHAMDELVGAGTPADKVAWITATASAAGGSEVADAATKWYAKILAKIMGSAAAIDDDLKVNAMRSNYGYIQNRAPVSMFHLAGRRDMCRKILFVKLCGNKYFPNRIGDGAVPPHSSCGFASRGGYTSCSPANGAKYTNRLAQQDAFYDADHSGMIAKGVQAASIRLGRTSTYATPNFGEDTTSLDADVTFDDGDTHAARTDQVISGIIASIDTNVVTSDSCASGGTCTAQSQAALTGY